MGILEDAIREHLDLKRKHGATEDELDRQEAEALGPARRAMAPADQTEDEGAEEHAADALEAEGEPAEGAADELAKAEFGGPDEPDLPEPAHHEPDLREPEHDLREPPDEAEVLPFGVEEDEAELEELDESDLELAERDEEEGDDPEGDDAEGDDVLEDTPDFLQETPEHDRLWFEQKPPRDFDFD